MIGTVYVESGSEVGFAGGGERWSLYEVVAVVESSSLSEVGLAVCLIGAAAYREGLGHHADVRIRAPYCVESLQVYRCRVVLAVHGDAEAEDVRRVKQIVEDIVPRVVDEVSPKPSSHDVTAGGS